MSGYVIRHGSTANNESGLTRGVEELRLTDKGREQARQAAEKLKGRGVDSLRSSDLRQAKETAEVIALAIGMTPRFVRGLRSIDLGTCTSKSEKELYPLVAKLAVEEPWTRFPGGQSYNEWKEEAWPEVRLFLLLTRFGRTPAIVTHGRMTNFIRAVLGSGALDQLDVAVLRNGPMQKSGEVWAVSWNDEKGDFEYGGPL